MAFLLPLLEVGAEVGIDAGSLGAEPGAEFEAVSGTDAAALRPI